TASKTRGAGSRQYVIRAGRVVPGRLGRERSHEYGARSERSACDRFTIDDQMLWRDAVRERNRLVYTPGQNHGAIRGQRGPRDVARGRLLADGFNHLLSQPT